MEAYNFSIRYFMVLCGPTGNRTPDSSVPRRCVTAIPWALYVGVTGIEPVTFSMSTKRSATELNALDFASLL